MECWGLHILAGPKHQSKAQVSLYYACKSMCTRLLTSYTQQTKYNGFILILTSKYFDFKKRTLFSCKLWVNRFKKLLFEQLCVLNIENTTVMLHISCQLLGSSTQDTRVVREIWLQKVARWLRYKMLSYFILVPFVRYLNIFSFNNFHLCDMTFLINFKYNVVKKSKWTNKLFWLLHAFTLVWFLALIPMVIHFYKR